MTCTNDLRIISMNMHVEAEAVVVPNHTFSELTVAVSEISMKSSGTLKDFILSFTKNKEKHLHKILFEMFRR